MDLLPQGDLPTVHSWYIHRNSALPGVFHVYLQPLKDPGYLGGRVAKSLVIPLTPCSSSLKYDAFVNYWNQNLYSLNYTPITFVSALGCIQHICYCDVAFNHLLMRDLTSYFVHVSDISKLMITYCINGQVANRILPELLVPTLQCRTFTDATFPRTSVLWHCRLGDRKGIWPGRIFSTRNPKRSFKDLQDTWPNLEYLWKMS